MAVNGIELAVGQKWKTRGGEIVEVLSDDKYHDYPWYLSSRESANNEGYIWDDCAFDSGDLITLIQDEHGFTPWNGGERPVEYGVKIEYKMKDDPAKVYEGFPDGLRWGHIGLNGDIIAYRVVKQEEQTKEITVETKTKSKEEPKYTVKEVFEAIIAETAFTPFPSVEQVQKHLARINHPDYNLYLQLKAKFE